MSLQIIKNIRGCPAALFAGYRFMLQHKNKNTTLLWTCAIQSCPGTILTYNNYNILEATSHSCVPNLARKQADLSKYNAEIRVLEALRHKQRQTNSGDAESASSHTHVPVMDKNQVDVSNCNEETHTIEGHSQGIKHPVDAGLNSVVEILDDDDFGSDYNGVMETPAEICENYQLKWSSYTTYIHSCIASSLMSEDSFADVALVTMDGHKIMAHRFVLSYSSQYLNKALKFQPKVTTALPIMIVLPQGITYKALKILVKYMYSGEATVAKDILNTVLKAGDILKIKGLYREPVDEDPSKIQKTSKITTQVQNPESQVTKAKEVKVPDSSPVISKNPPPLVAASSVVQKIIQSQNENTKAKEVQKVQQKMLQTKVQNKMTEKVVTTNSNSIKQYGGPRVLNFTMSNFNGMEKENASPKRAIILNQKITHQQDKPHTITSADAESQNSSDSTTLTIKAENGKSDNQSYLVIKDEPVEWTETELQIVDEKDVFEEESVKREHYDSTSNEGKDEFHEPLTIEKRTHLGYFDNENIGRNISNDPIMLDRLDLTESHGLLDSNELLNVPALILKNTACQVTEDHHEQMTVEEPVHLEDVISIPDSDISQHGLDQESILIDEDIDDLPLVELAKKISDNSKSIGFGESTNKLMESPTADFSTITSHALPEQFKDDTFRTGTIQHTWPMFDGTSKPLDVVALTKARASDDYDSDSDAARPRLELSTLRQFDMIGFIKYDQIGKAILQRAYKDGLTNSDRDRLADLVVTHFMNKFGVLGLKQLKILAKKMEDIPNEKSIMYLVPPVSKRDSVKGKSEAARGKFMDKVRNRLTLIRHTLGMVRTKKSSDLPQFNDQNSSSEFRHSQMDISDSDSQMEPPAKQPKLGEDVLPHFSLEENTLPFTDDTNKDSILKSFNLNSFISHDLLGQALLKKAHKGMLNNCDRDRLADLVMTHFMNRFDGQLGMKFLKNLGKLFEKYIPYEKCSTYYVDPVHKDRSKKGKSEPARGKLVDKYRNLRQLIRTLSQQRQSKGCKDKSDMEESGDWEGQSQLSEVQESQSWLKTNFTPENEVINHWEKSFAIRRNSNLDLSLVFEEWPILKTAVAPMLISNDFARILQPKEDFNFENKFNAMFTRVCNGRLLSINPVDRSMYGLLEDNISTDAQSIIKLHLLPSLIPNRSRTFVGKSHWKPSVQESRHGWLLHITKSEDIEEEIRKRIEYKTNKGLTTHPYVMVVGEELKDIEKSYVVVNEHYIPCERVLDSLYLCFKIYHVFNLKYPFECQHLWHLIQWELFKYRTPMDAPIAFMNDILTT